MDGLYWDDDDDREGLAVEVAGYPDDVGGGGKELWSAIGNIAEPNGNLLRHDVDVAGGQSGAPIFTHSGYDTCPYNCVHGISAYGMSSGLNGGPWLNQGIAQGIEQVASMRARPCEGPSC